MFKYIALVCLALSGCASGKLMKCPTLPSDDVFYCPEHVQDDFHKCGPPVDTYICQEPQ